MLMPSYARRLLVALVLLPALFTVMTGCGGTARTELFFDKGPVNEPIMIDVESFGGAVVVEAAPEAETVVIYATLRAGHDWYKVAKNLKVNELTASLEHIDIQAELVRGGRGTPLLQVTTSTSYRYPDVQWVDLHIVAPAAYGVHVSTKRGMVDLVDVRGPITVGNVRGHVVVRGTQPINAPVNISTTAGHIQYQVASSSTGAIDAQAVGGTARVHAVDQPLPILQETDAHALAQLGAGTNPVVLRTIDGDIDVYIRDSLLTRAAWLHW